jgi:hypothetical protein
MIEIQFSTDVQIIGKMIITDNHMTLQIIFEHYTPFLSNTKLNKMFCSLKLSVTKWYRSSLQRRNLKKINF